MSRLKKIAFEADKSIIEQQAVEIIDAIEKLREETDDVLDHARLLISKCQAYKGPAGDNTASEIAQKYINEITRIIQDDSEFSLNKLKLTFENDISELQKR